MRTDAELKEIEDDLGRPLTGTELRVLDREDRGHSFLLSRLGFEDDEGYDPNLGYDALREAGKEHLRSQLTKLISTCFTGEAMPKVQKKVYLGRLKSEVTIDTMRNTIALAQWATQQHLELVFEQDGRVYLCSSYWHYKDPNRLPYGWISMVFDGLAEGFENDGQEEV